MMKKCLFILLGYCCILSCAACTKDNNKAEVETEVDSAIGEAAPSQEVIDLKDSQEYFVGDTIAIIADNNEYELTIDAVSYIEATNEHAEKPKQVVLIDYTYTNKSDELLLIDSMRFQLLNEAGDSAYEPYYFEEKITAEPAAKDTSISAQIAFAQNDNDTELVLVYQDTSDDSLEPIIIRINEIK